MVSFVEFSYVMVLLWQLWWDSVWCCRARYVKVGFDKADKVGWGLVPYGTYSSVRFVMEGKQYIIIKRLRLVAASIQDTHLS